MSVRAAVYRWVKKVLDHFFIEIFILLLNISAVPALFALWAVFAFDYGVAERGYYNVHASGFGEILLSLPGDILAGSGLVILVVVTALALRDLVAAPAFDLGTIVAVLGDYNLYVRCSEKIILPMPEAFAVDFALLVVVGVPAFMVGFWVAAPSHLDVHVGRQQQQQQQPVGTPELGTGAKGDGNDGSATTSTTTRRPCRRRFRRPRGRKTATPPPSPFVFRGIPNIPPAGQLFARRASRGDMTRDVPAPPVFGGRDGIFGSGGGGDRF